MPRDLPVLPDFTPGESTFKPVPMFTYANSLANETGGRITRPDAINMLDATLSSVSSRR